MLKAGFLVLLVHIFSIGYSENRVLRFDHIALPDDVASRSANCLLEDTKGFIWIGLRSGLARYDGYQARLVDRVSDDKEITKFGHVISLLEDPTGMIWVGTMRGLYVYDRITETTRLFTGVDLKGVQCRSLFLTKSGEVVIGTNKGVHIYDPASGNVESYVSHPGITEGLSHNVIRSIYEDRQGVLWLGTYDRLNRLDRGKSHFTHYRLQSDHQLQPRNNLVLSIAPVEQSADSLLLIGTETGLCLFNSKTEEFRQYRHTRDKYALSNDVIKTSCVVNRGEVWLGTDMGLNIFNYMEEKFYTFYHDYENSFSISNNVINDILKDSNGNVWVASGNGVDKVYIRKRGIVHNQFFPQTPLLRGGIPIRSFAQEASGDYWLATDEGVVRYDIENANYEYYTPPQLLHNRVREIFIDSKERVWIASPGGLNLFDASENRFFKYVANVDDDKALNSNYITSVAEDSKGNIWVGTYNSGLYRVIQKEDHELEFINFKNIVNNPNSISSNNIVDIVCDSKGLIWISTDKGIDQLNPLSGMVKSFLSGKTKYGVVPEAVALRLHYEKNKAIWIASTKGLYRWDIKAQQFQHFEDVSFMIKSIVTHNGSVWITTFKSLYQFNPETSKLVKIPSKETGITSYTGAVYRNKNGQLFFGGYEGFVAFHPKQINTQAPIPQVQITDFSILNKSIKPYQEFNNRFILDKSIDDTEAIELKYGENTFGLEFSALNYNHGDAGNYQYILEGYETEWQTLQGVRNFVSYTRVKPGRYVFQIKAANSYGEFSNNSRVLHIRVRPPVWASWWAILIYLCVLVTLFIISRKLLIARLKYRDNLRFEKLQREKSEELVLVKTRFFTNVSHELKTPLTLISSPVERLLSMEEDPTKVRTLQIVKRNTERLIRLVNQVLDMRKVEKGVEKLNIQKYDIILFCHRIFNQFNDEAVHRNIFIQFLSDKKNSIKWFDQEKLEKVLYNLLSNAFKFTPDKGRITLEIAHEEVSLPHLAQPREHLVIKVIDTGVGISKENQALIFERFSNVKVTNFSSQEGTGIGLSLVSDYVKLHNGVVTCESMPHKGSVFTVYIPAEKNMFREYHEVNDDQEDEVDFQEEDSGENCVLVDDTHDGRDEVVQKPQLLIVEDDRDMRTFLQDSFSDLYNVEPVADGQEGVKQAIKGLPDLIISDVMMPNLNGIELCTRLKTDIRTCHIPIILLTAKGGLENKMLGIETGADDYIQKPFNVDYLILRVGKLIEQREKLRKAYVHQIQLEPSEVTVTSMDEKFLQELVGKVEAQIDNSELNVSMLSSIMNLSQTNLYRKIKALTGLSTTEFIRSIRLKRAAQLLKNEELNVTDVMYMVGFTHRSYFTRSFKEMYGVIPKDYK